MPRVITKLIKLLGKELQQGISGRWKSRNHPYNVRKILAFGGQNTKPMQRHLGLTGGARSIF
jgi:hypothetical protein